MSKAHSRLLVLWLIATLLAVPAWACSVPVFRYALERWPSDPYQAIVFHRGALTDAQKAAVRSLAPEGLAGTVHANIAVRTVDLDQSPDADLVALWKSAVELPAVGRSRPVDPHQPQVPWMVVGPPGAKEADKLVWSGPLDEASARQIIDSPARREIVQRLGRGESIVWVLVEIGEPLKDDAAAKMLEGRLKYLASVLELPKLDQRDLAFDAAESPLRVAFSMIRVSRYDEAERAFSAMLVNSEPGLAEIHEPMAFPIFGRGRSLYALAGQGINQEHIDEASSFLIGSCSCEVKEQNPGVDLLVSADWDQLIRPTLSPDIATPARANLTTPGAGAITDLTSLGPLDLGSNHGAATEVVSIQPAAQAAPQPAKPMPPPIFAAVILAALSGVFFVLRRRR